MRTAKKYVQSRLDPADIKLNGDRPFDMQVIDERTYSRILLNGSLGLGEAYMDGLWECPQLDEFFNRIFKIASYEKAKRFKEFWLILKSTFANMQFGSRSSDVVKTHYDLGNDLFINMLDKRMVYTCGYWKNAENLDEAQEAKLDLICRKLSLQPGQRILDIGCGWGSFAKYAAEKYGVSVIGITISKKQHELAQTL